MYNSSSGNYSSQTNQVQLIAVYILTELTFSKRQKGPYKDPVPIIGTLFGTVHVYLQKGLVCIVCLFVA